MQCILCGLKKAVPETDLCSDCWYTQEHLPEEAPYQDDPEGDATREMLGAFQDALDEIESLKKQLADQAIEHEKIIKAQQMSWIEWAERRGDGWAHAYSRVTGLYNKQLEIIAGLEVMVARNGLGYSLARREYKRARDILNDAENGGMEVGDDWHDFTAEEERKLYVEGAKTLKKIHTSWINSRPTEFIFTREILRLYIDHLERYKDAVDFCKEFFAELEEHYFTYPQEQIHEVNYLIDEIRVLQTKAQTKLDEQIAAKKAAKQAQKAISQTQSQEGEDGTQQAE